MVDIGGANLRCLRIATGLNQNSREAGYFPKTIWKETWGVSYRSSENFPVKVFGRNDVGYKDIIPFFCTRVKDETLALLSAICKSCPHLVFSIEF